MTDFLLNPSFFEKHDQFFMGRNTSMDEDINNDLKINNEECNINNDTCINLNNEEECNLNNDRSINLNNDRSINPNNDHSINPNNDHSINPNNDSSINSNNDSSINLNNDEECNINPNNDSSINLNNEEKCNTSLNNEEECTTNLNNEEECNTNLNNEKKCNSDNEKKCNSDNEEKYNPCNEEECNSKHDNKNASPNNKKYNTNSNSKDLVKNEPPIENNIFLDKEYIDPYEYNNQIFYLTKNKSSWITISHLPEELSIYTQNNFNILFNLHPTTRGKIIMFDKEVDSSRWHQSYLKTPKYDPNRKCSYMFSGIENNEYINTPLPEEFTKYYNFMKNIDPKYNQVVGNWYENKEDHIAFHSDCELGMINNAVVSILSFNESDMSIETERTLIIRPKIYKKGLASDVFIKLRHGSIITMGGDIQKEFVHGILKEKEDKSRRISLSFRQFV